MGVIMKKLAIMKTLMMAMRSKRQAPGRTAPTRPRPVAAPGSCFNQYEKFCCRFAAGAAIGNNRYNS